MIDEIELHLESSILVGYGRRRQSTRGDIEGDVPPVIHQRSQRLANFSDDLRPHVQRGVCILPSFEWQLRPSVNDLAHFDASSLLPVLFYAVAPVKNTGSD